MQGTLNSNDQICQYCSEKRKKLFSYVNGKNIRLVTMGPKGTTSSIAAEYFKKYALNNMNAADVEIMLYDTFESASIELKKENADFILLPNAYGKMTNFYWDITLELIFTFIIQTPEYGIAAIDVDKVRSKKQVTIATCKAVEHLVSELWSALGMTEKNYIIVEAYSTKKSLMLLEEGKVDFALTNNTSLVGSNAFFITHTMHTEVLWSVFMQKQVGVEN